MKEHVKNVFDACVALLIVGIVIIFNAANIGESIGSIAMQLNGGTMFTEYYNDLVNASTTAFILLGFICSLVSGIGILLFNFYKAIKLDNIELEKQETP